MINWWIIFGVGLTSVSVLPYIRELLSYRVRPKLVSWVIWSVLASVMTLSAFQTHQLASGLMSLVTLGGCGIVVSLGWIRGDRTVTRLDMVCLGGAALGLIALVFLRDPTVALVLSVGVDAIAFIPTFVHGWVAPREESFACFLLASLGAAGTLIAALQGPVSLEGVLYPSYAILFDGAMAAILLVGRATLWRETRYSYGTGE